MSGLESIAHTHYLQLRHLTTPVVAVTSAAGGVVNGMISNSAQRASLVPDHPRISIYISKTNYTHDLVMASGAAGIHLLRSDQWDLIWHLGLQSRRELDKLATVETKTLTTGVPILTDVYIGYDCRVINTMDAGGATFFLFEIVDSLNGRDGDVMTSPHFRANMTPDKKIIYEQRLLEAMDDLELMSENVDTSKRWSGPTKAVR